MRLEDAKRVVSERTVAAAGYPPHEAPGLVECPPRDPEETIRLLLSGCDLGDDLDAVVAGLQSAAVNATHVMLACQPGSEVACLRAAMAQVFLTGFLMGLGE